MSEDIATEITKQAVVDAMLEAITGSNRRMWTAEEMAILQRPRRSIPVDKSVSIYTRNVGLGTNASG